MTLRVLCQINSCPLDGAPYKFALQGEAKTLTLCPEHARLLALTVGDEAASQPVHRPVEAEPAARTEAQRRADRAQRRYRVVPDDETLRNMLIQGVSVAEMAQRYGVTSEAIRIHLRRLPEWEERRTKRLDHSQYIPWRVLAHHKTDRSKGAQIYRSLWLYSSRMQGRELRPKDSDWLDKWLSWMDGNNEWSTRLSVRYDRRDGFSIWARTTGTDSLTAEPAISASDESALHSQE